MEPSRRAAIVANSSVRQASHALTQFISNLPIDARNNFDFFHFPSIRDHLLIEVGAYDVCGWSDANPYACLFAIRRAIAATWEPIVGILAEQQKLNLSNRQNYVAE